MQTERTFPPAFTKAVPIGNVHPMTKVCGKAWRYRQPCIQAFNTIAGSAMNARCRRSDPVSGARGAVASASLSPKYTCRSRRVNVWLDGYDTSSGQLTVATCAVRV